MSWIKKVFHRRFDQTNSVKENNKKGLELSSNPLKLYHRQMSKVPIDGEVWLGFVVKYRTFLKEVASNAFPHEFKRVTA